MFSQAESTTLSTASTAGSATAILLAIGTVIWIMAGKKSKK